MLMAHANNPSCMLLHRMARFCNVGQGFIHAGLIFGRGSTALRVKFSNIFRGAYPRYACAKHAAHPCARSTLIGHLMASETTKISLDHQVSLAIKLEDIFCDLS